MDEHFDATVTRPVLSREMEILFIHDSIQYKNDIALALISCHAYASPVNIYQLSKKSIELLSIITQNEEKDVYSSRKEGEKLGGAGSFTLLATDYFNPFSPKAVPTVTPLEMGGGRGDRGRGGSGARKILRDGSDRLYNERNDDRKCAGCAGHPV